MISTYFAGFANASWITKSHLGGTWDLYRYPGIRSDSDMYTLGYSFKPWEARLRGPD